MLQYEVVAREEFVMLTTYRVTADTPEIAEAQCRDGLEGYVTATPEDDPGDWLSTVSVTEVPSG